MNEAEFWHLIERTKEGIAPCNEEQQAAQLLRFLKELPVEEVAEFHKFVEQKSLEAYRWDLWAIAYIIHFGCSDDGFSDFREWLIAQGRSFYEKALANPTFLADFAEPGDSLGCGSFGLVAFGLYKEMTGSYPETTLVYSPAGKTEPQGEEWSDEDLPKRYPEACKKFGFDPHNPDAAHPAIKAIMNGGESRYR